MPIPTPDSLESAFVAYQKSLHGLESALQIKLKAMQATLDHLAGPRFRQANRKPHRKPLLPDGFRCRHCRASFAGRPVGIYATHIRLRHPQPAGAKSARTHKP